MTKAELIEVITAKTQAPSKALVTSIIDQLFLTAGATVKKEGKFSYPGFGTFSLRKRKARKGRNPQTGEVIKIKASKTVGFKPAPRLKNSL